MRIAIIADIHGNIFALEKTYHYLSKCDEVWVLGDIVGYYYSPRECMEFLKQFNCQYIMGNHEFLLKKYLSNELNPGEMKKKYGSGLEFAKKNLTSSHITQILSWPEKLELNYSEKSILLAHGSPSQNNEYIYPDNHEKHLEIFSLEFNIVALGHTHKPMVITRSNQLIINPGSIGQPRDKDPRCSFSVLDLENLDVQMIRLEYDLEPLLNQIDKYDSEVEILKSILLRK